MTETVRLGTVGTGAVGSIMSRSVDSKEGVEVVGVTDVDETNRTETAEDLFLPADRRFEAHETTLEALDLDGVIVATPHAMHYEQVVAALDRGVDVMYEKPLYVDLDHARDLVRRAESATANLMIGYQRHVSRPFLHARDNMAEHVGDPQFVTAQITQNWLENQRGT